jgi:HK97 family phage prohead protease
MQTDNELRVLAEPIELRAGKDGKPVLVGYAAKFNSRSHDLGGFVEIVAPGAFKTSLANKPDVRALYEHDPAKILGRATAGTLTLAEDGTGLRVEITPPDTTIGRDVLELVKRGDISGMSFGFRTISDTWHEDPDKRMVRTLQEVVLNEVSVVGQPAYPQTEIALRSLDRHRQVRQPADRRTLAAARCRLNRELLKR